MPKRLKNNWRAPSVMWVGLCLALSAPVHGSTVGKMIAHMKQQKEFGNWGQGQNQNQSQNPNSAPAQRSSPTGAAGKPVDMPKLPTTPMLWSLMGMGEELQAVLVYQGKAYVAKANMPRSRMGPWWIQAVSAQGVELVLHDKPKAEPLVLLSPERGGSIETYAMDIGVYHARAALAGAATAQTTTPRMNTASNGFTALWGAKEGDPLWMGNGPADPQTGPLPDNLNPGPVPKKP